MISDFERILRETAPEVPMRRDEPLSRHTTFRIGGPADGFVCPDTPEALEAILRAARRSETPYYILGNGSNVLFADAGFRGVVIATGGLSRMDVTGTHMHCAGGASLTGAAMLAQKSALSGLAFAYGIPGTVGGAVYMNAGAYEGEMADVVTSSVYYDTERDVRVTLDAPSHAFAYRHSVYEAHPAWVILEATLQLTEGDADAILAVMNDLMCRRREKQPLAFPSAGSTFKRVPGQYTAQMIDACGLKGFGIGGAQVSEKHAGFIVNRGGATADDVMRLVSHIQKEVLSRFGVEIPCEIRVVGER